MAAGVEHVDELVARFSTVLGTLFGDLNFLAPNGTLSLAVDQTISGLRIELPTKNPLHLHSVAIDTVEPMDLVAGTKRTASSSWGEYGDKLQAGLLFDPSDAHGTAVHTNNEEQPWLEIAFREPTKVERVTLRNVDSWTASRARHVVVRLQNELGEWQTTYDGAAREQLLRDVVTASLSHSAPELAGHQRVMLPVLVDIAGASYGVAHKAVEAAAFPDDLAKPFRGAVNRHVLSERKLEWTIHGIKRSFRFWPEPERKRYVGLARDIATELSGLTPNVCFGFGSVLSIVRDGALIPHDDDLDIIIGFEPHEAPTLAAGLDRVREFLEPRGYTVTGEHMAHRWIRRRGGSETVDVFVGIFEGDNIDWYPGKRGRLTRSMMFPPSYAPLLGHECPVPRSPLLYLEQVYGPTWRIPDPGFQHRWVQRDYSDISGRNAESASS